MHSLIVKTSVKLNHHTERIVRDAYDYLEKPKTQSAVVAIMKWCYLNDGITPEIEDYVLDVLSGRATPIGNHLLLHG